jgi:hypothetical protein
MSKAQMITNNLIYTVPKASTLAIQKNDQKNYFDQRNYTAGQTIRCTFQTGSRYVDCLNSQLCFDVITDNVAGSVLTWGQGSALNLIKGVRVYSKSGTELVNVQNHNVSQMIEDKCSKPKKFFDTVGSLMGYNYSNNYLGGCGSGNQVNSRFADIANNATTEIQIPLSSIAAIFNPSAKTLMPSMLASGLVLEIDLATAKECCQRTGGATDNTVDIRNIYLNLCCTTLSDNAVGSMNEVAGKDLIEYTYVDTYTSRLTQNADNQVVSTAINKAVGFASHIVSVECAQAQRGDQTQDEFSLISDDVEYQYQLGSVQLPSQVPVKGERLAYKQLLKTYNEYMVESEGSALGFLNYNLFVGAKTCSFSKDQFLALSNMPINSSRSLRYEQKYATAPVSARTIFVFLKYIKVLRVSLTDTSVNF